MRDNIFLCVSLEYYLIDFINIDASMNTFDFSVIRSFSFFFLPFKKKSFFPNPLYSPRNSWSTTLKSLSEAVDLFLR